LSHSVTGALDHQQFTMRCWKAVEVQVVSSPCYAKA